MKIICWRFYIKTPFTFSDMRTWVMWKVCLQTWRNNKICWKLAYFFKNLQISRTNNSRILKIKNAKFSGYCFYLNTNWIKFQVQMVWCAIKGFPKYVISIKENLSRLSENLWKPFSKGAINVIRSSLYFYST